MSPFCSRLSQTAPVNRGVSRCCGNTSHGNRFSIPIDTGSSTTANVARTSFTCALGLNAASGWCGCTHATELGCAAPAPATSPPPTRKQARPGAAQIRHGPSPWTLTSGLVRLWARSCHSFAGAFPPNSPHGILSNR